jgi:hypothetical protein
VISGDTQCPVIIAMTAVLMVKVTVDQIVDVIAMRNGGMTAAGTMAMRGVMGAAAVPIRARLGVRGTHRDGVFVDMAVMVVVQMPVVEIVDVIVVANCEVSTVLSVNVAVILVSAMWSRHGGPFWCGCSPRSSMESRDDTVIIVPSIHQSLKMKN